MISLSATTTNAPILWLDAMVNRYLSLDPEVAQKMLAFEGRVIAIELLGINKKFYLLPQTDTAGTCIKLSESFEGKPDTTIKGTPAALFKMGLASDVAPMMLKGEVEITGDFRLGRAFKKLLAEMEVDWAEHLALLVGDAPAHHIARVAKQFTGWMSKARQSISTDISEYLQEESRDVVAGAELEMFYDDVDELRNDVDRLQARVDVFNKKAKAGRA